MEYTDQEKKNYKNTVNKRKNSFGRWKKVDEFMSDLKQLIPHPRISLKGLGIHTLCNWQECGVGLIAIELL